MAQSWGLPWKAVPLPRLHSYRRQAAAHAGTLLAFGLPFLLYALTLAPTVYNLDSAELTTAAATGGIVRATGYPLYLLLGRLWAALPIGDVGYRLNLFSAFNGALTVALAERILRRLGAGPWARFGALGLLAAAPAFWSLSLIAEVYTLHTAFVAGLILLLLRWAERPSPGRLALAAGLGALSLGNQVAGVLLVPGCIWYAASVAPRQVVRPRTWLLVLGAALAGISIYLYLPLRYLAQPAFNYAGTYDAAGRFTAVDLATPAGLWWLVSGRAFAGQMLAYQGPELWRETMVFAGQLASSFLGVGLGPGLLGLAVLLRRDGRLGGLLLLMFLGHVGFYVDYLVIDKEAMFLPAFLIWALWLGVGYQQLLDWLADPAGATPRGLLAGRAAIAGAVLLALAWWWPQVDLSNDWSTRERGEDILRAVAPRAIIFGWWDDVPIVQYLQLVEGQRPDVVPISRFLIDGRDLRRLIEREAARRPVYINEVSPGLLAAYAVEPAGPLYRLRPRMAQNGPGTCPPSSGVAWPGAAGLAWCMR